MSSREDRLRDLAYRAGTVEQDLRNLANGYTEEADLDSTAAYLDEIVTELAALRSEPAS